MTDRIVFSGSSNQFLAREVSHLLDAPLGLATIKRFPDGERYIKIENEVKGKECVVIQSTGYPQDENLFELFTILDTLKYMGAGKIITVVPYFGYGRQDKVFKTGEAVTSRTASKHIQMDSDEFISINLHEESILDNFQIPARNLDASPLLGSYLKEHGFCAEKSLVLAPDKSAFPMAKVVSEIMGCSTDYLEKCRLGPGECQVRPKNLEARGANIIIVDDMIDSGGSMMEAIRLLKEQEASSVTIATVHPVLTGSAVTRLCHAGAKDVIATNTIRSEVSRISVAGLIAGALKR